MNPEAKPLPLSEYHFGRLTVENAEKLGIETEIEVDDQTIAIRKALLKAWVNEISAKTGMQLPRPLIAPIVNLHARHWASEEARNRLNTLLEETELSVEAEAYARFIVEQLLGRSIEYGIANQENHEPLSPEEHLKASIIQVISRAALYAGFDAACFNTIQLKVLYTVTSYLYKHSPEVDRETFYAAFRRELQPTIEGLSDDERRRCRLMMKLIADQLL